jgi:hypothetical protein
MSEIEMKTANEAETQAGGVEQTEEQRSKDAFYVQMAQITEAMIARHGKEFTIGTLILAARFIAEGRPLAARTNGHEEPMASSKA